MLILNGAANRRAACGVLTAPNWPTCKWAASFGAGPADGSRRTSRPGTAGFAFAALRGGQPAAVLSLWEVADDLRALHVELFRSTTAGMRPSTALERLSANSLTTRIREPRSQRLGRLRTLRPVVVGGSYLEPRLRKAQSGKLARLDPERRFGHRQRTGPSACSPIQPACVTVRATITGMRSCNSTSLSFAAVVTIV